MFLVVGLGNPGSEYKNTRHNIGFMAVDVLFRRYNFSGWKKKYNAEISEGMIEGQKVMLLKPQTYMNLSGQAVQAVMAFYKIKPECIFVIHDEMDCALGKIKAKVGGGAGGHNGLKSIDSHCGQNYARLRFGIGRSPHQQNSADWVLGRFSLEDKEILEPLLEEIAEIFPLGLKKGVSEITSRLAVLHQKKKKSEKEQKERRTQKDKDKEDGI